MPRKARIEYRPNTSLCWLVVVDEPENHYYAMHDTGFGVITSGMVTLPLEAWRKRFDVEFPRWDNDNVMTNGCVTYTFKAETQLDSFRREHQPTDYLLKADLERLNNCECEDCNKRFYIPGIYDLPEGIQLRHTDGHDSDDYHGYPTIISDKEKTRVEEAAKKAREDEHGRQLIALTLTLGIGHGVQLQGQRRYLDAITAAISDGRIKFD